MLSETQPSTTLQIAGWPVRLSCQPDKLQSAVSRRFSAYASTDSPNALAVSIALLDTEMDAGPHLVLSSAITFEHNLFRVEADGLSGWVDLPLNRAAFTMRSATPVAEVEYLLRVLLAIVAQRDGGMLLHAAGLVLERKAVLFFGASGSGKSTVVSLSRRAAVLSDDLVVVRPPAEPQQDSRWLAHPTPFWNGDVKRSYSDLTPAPVSAAYRLVQDRDVYLEPISRGKAVAELAASCPVVNGIPGILGRVMQTCSDFAQTVPVQRLHFRQDASFWRLVHPGLLSGGDHRANG